MNARPNRVSVLVEFGGEPDTFAERVEELDHGEVVDVAFAATGEQLLAQLWCEQDHAALLSIEGST
jgi:hypothetical protein